MGSIEVPLTLHVGERSRRRSARWRILSHLEDPPSCCTSKNERPSVVCGGVLLSRCALASCPRRASKFVVQQPKNIVSTCPCRQFLWNSNGTDFKAVFFSSNLNFRAQLSKYEYEFGYHMICIVSFLRSRRSPLLCASLWSCCCGDFGDTCLSFGSAGGLFPRGTTLLRCITRIICVLCTGTKIPGVLVRSTRYTTRGIANVTRLSPAANHDPKSRAPRPASDPVCTTLSTRLPLADLSPARLHIVCYVIRFRSILKPNSII